MIEQIYNHYDALRSEEQIDMTELRSCECGCNGQQFEIERNGYSFVVSQPSSGLDITVDGIDMFALDVEDAILAIDNFDINEYMDAAAMAVLNMRGDEYMA